MLYHLMDWVQWYLSYITVVLSKTQCKKRGCIYTCRHNNPAFTVMRRCVCLCVCAMWFEFVRRAEDYEAKPLCCTEQQRTERDECKQEQRERERQKEKEREWLDVNRCKHIHTNTQIYDVNTDTKTKWSWREPGAPKTLQGYKKHRSGTLRLEHDSISVPKSANCIISK